MVNSKPYVRELLFILAIRSLMICTQMSCEENIYAMILTMAIGFRYLIEGVEKSINLIKDSQKFLDDPEFEKNLRKVKNESIFNSLRFI